MEFEDFLRKELIRDYNKIFLETVTGPDIYGPGNFEVYLDDDDAWKIRPNEKWKPPELRGIFNTEDE